MIDIPELIRRHQMEEEEEMKDFEFITEEDLRDRFPGVVPGWQTIPNLLQYINKLLNEKAGKGCCRVGTIDFICGDIPKNAVRKSDTHEAFVFLRPIEEERPECKCRKLLEFVESMEKTGVDDPRSHLVNFCPDCGNNLKGETNATPKTET